VRFFKSETAAKAFAARAAQDRAEIGRRWSDLPAHRRHATLETLAEMEAAGQTLQGVWNAFRAERLKAADTTNRKTLREVIDELAETKRRTQKRENYVKGLVWYCRRFARGREEMTVDKVTEHDVEAWFAERKEALSTQASNLFRLSCMFSLAVRRGYRADNPCDRVERITVEERPPQIFSVHRSAKILIRAAKREPAFLNWVAMCLCAGLRPEEADKVGPEHLELERGVIRLSAAISKVRTSRIVHLTPSARAWLTLAQRLGSRFKMPHATRRRCQRRLREWMKLPKWPQDILRHTAASHLLAHFQSFSHVGMELGNSETILRKHYRELVTKEHGDAFVAMEPSRRMLERAIRLRKAA
jgi:hypothetical protein